MRGGLRPIARLAAGRVVRRPPPPRTSRDRLQDKLRAKGYWLSDVETNPVCLGVPLGRNKGNPAQVAVDVGLKELAVVDINELVAASPELKQNLLKAAADGEDVDVSDSIFSRAGTVTTPMNVMAVEDLQGHPIVAPVHPDALLPQIPEDKLGELRDKFFLAVPGVPEVKDLVVDAVPDADANVTLRAEYRRHRSEKTPTS